MTNWQTDLVRSRKESVDPAVALANGITIASVRALFNHCFPAVLASSVAAYALTAAACSCAHCWTEKYAVVHVCTKLRAALLSRSGSLEGPAGLAALALAVTATRLHECLH